MSPRPGPSARILRAALTVAAIGAIVWAFTASLDDAEAITWPPVERLLAAGVLHAGAMTAAWFAWSTLLGSLPPAALAPGFFLAQIAKYIPGSIWQGIGQVLDAERQGIGRGHASLAFLLQLMTQVVAGGLLGLLALAAAPLPMVLRVLAGALALSVVFVRRRWLGCALRMVARRVPRLHDLPNGLPSSGRIFLAVALGTFTLTASGTAFGLLLPRETTSIVAAVGVFALAWTAGFLVVPLPSGLGVREFVLVAGLAEAGMETAEVLAVSIVLRLIAIVVDGLAAGVSQLARLTTTGQ